MHSVIPRALSAAERLDWLRLIRSENVGPITFFQLMARFGSARDALAALPELARRGGRSKAIRLCDKASAEREIEGLAGLGAKLVAWGEDEYPAPLAALEDAPPLVAVRGHPHILKRPALAIVGARNASANGRRFAQTIARELGEAGIVISSGLARGIDAAAHEGALETGTVAVVAGGIDVVYPKENAGLYDRIAEQGVVMAEEPLGMEPQARHFPKRNRLISGVALGVIVVEAAQRSGSLITARFALEQGREVFAVPGSPLDPRCRGTNDLIRNGATLVESAADVLPQIAGMLRPAAGEKTPHSYAGAPPRFGEQELDSARAKVVESLGPTPVQVDEIVRQCQLSPAIVAAVLLELELADRLDRHPGHQVSLAGYRAE
jgi:DNA processing protein